MSVTEIDIWLIWFRYQHTSHEQRHWCSVKVTFIGLYMPSYSPSQMSLRRKVLENTPSPAPWILDVLMQNTEGMVRLALSVTPICTYRVQVNRNLFNINTRLIRHGACKLLFSCPSSQNNTESFSVLCIHIFDWDTYIISHVTLMNKGCFDDVVVIALCLKTRGCRFESNS